MTDETVDILLVEDNPGDARLIREMLKEPGAAGFRIENAARLDEALKRAAAGPVDAILLDLGLPDNSGLDTLREVRARCPAVPVVVMTGLNDEETGVEAVQQGAQDYLVKGQTDAVLLARSLRYAIERKRAEGALRHEQAYNKAVLASMADGLFVIAGNGAIRSCNGRALSMLGYDEKDLLSHSVGKIFAPSSEQPDAELERIRRGLRGGELRDLDARLLRRDGSLLAASLSCAPLPEQGTAGPEVVLVARDITDRRQLQEEQQQYAERLAEEAKLAREYAEAVLRVSDPQARLIGKGAAYKSIISFVRDAAGAPSPVLVLGESGTGKEVVARAIRLNGPRAEKPFIVVDCSTLGASLLESELFGHEEGAFTGATKAKAGLVEIADGGTLFVDEIGEMPLELQAKLLRALEHGEFRRVGSVKPRKVDIRVIAATNRDLAKEVKKGGFRKDLYYRLNVLTITLPPLRDRREDIPLLAQHFLEHSRVTLPGKKRFRRPTLEHLQAYDWPGNVREMANVIDRAVILSRGEECITLDHLPPEVRKGRRSRVPPSRGGRSKSLAEAEREAIVAALAEVSGNRTKAAAMLGITRVTLREKIRKYKMEPDKRER